MATNAQWVIPDAPTVGQWADNIAILRDRVAGDGRVELVLVDGGDPASIERASDTAEGVEVDIDEDVITSTGTTTILGTTVDTIEVEV